jgi:hypothetical protein
MPGAAYMVSNMSSISWRSVHHLLDRLGDGAQARVGKLEDGQLGHGRREGRRRAQRVGPSL